jgi:hypothetical protein
MTDLLDLARRYLGAIEASDQDTLEALFDPAMVYRELPNRLMPEGSLNDRSTMLKRFGHGKKILRSQRYERS